MDCESLLLELGAAEVLTGSSLGQTTALAASRTVDFAVLDVNLGAENSLPLAERLSGARVPFVFATGYGEVAAIGDRFAGTPDVTKPYSRDDLAAACDGALECR